MSDTPSLINHFLIAMPTMADPNFSHTVTYICAHNSEGAMGVVINRPSGLVLGEVYGHMGIEARTAAAVELSVLAGGPVQADHGFVLHSPVGKWHSSLAVTPDIALTTSRDVLAAIAQGRGPKRFVVAVGYAGWGAGQLEQEMADNTWLSTPADPKIIFDTPIDQRWMAAAALIGIDLHRLSSQVGHA